MRATYYFVCLALPTLILLASWATAFHFQLGVPVEKQLAKRGELWKQKRDLLSNFGDRQKLVIVSGSNSYISLSASALERRLGVPTINFGFMAGFGFRYIAAAVTPYLRPGDTVLLPLEYWFYDKHWADLYFPLDTKLFLVRQDPAYYRGLPLTEKLQIVYAMEFKHLLAGMKVRAGYRDPPTITVPDKTSDWRGDFIGSKMHNPNIFSRIRIPEYEYYEDSLQLDSVRDFVAWANRRGVQLLATYPSHLASSSVTSPEQPSKIQSFWQDLDVPIIGEYPDFFYTPEYIFDTVYHLTESGRQRHTALVSEAVCEAISAQIIDARGWSHGCNE